MHHHWLFHPDQPTDAMREDLQVSLKRLTHHWGVSDAPSFCYPNGNYDRRAVLLLRDAGVRLGFTSQSGFVDASTDPLLLPRFTMTNSTRAKFICALSALGNRSLRLFGRQPPALPAD